MSNESTRASEQPDDFDRAIQLLASAMRNEQTIDAFEAGYQRLLTRLVNGRLLDVQGIHAGVYRARLEILQSLAREQMAWARERWPEEFARVDREFHEARAAQRTEGHAPARPARGTDKRARTN